MYAFYMDRNKKIVLILIVLIISLLISGFWFLLKNDSSIEELGLEPGTAFAADETPSLRVDLGQAGLDTKVILANSEINISGPESNLNRDNFEIDLVSAQNGEYDLKIKPKKPTLRPGRYHVSARFVTEQGIKDYSQDFYWGVLALNTNKATYLPNENAYLQMAVLDDQGSTICDADLILKITDPQGRMKFLKTKEGTIIRNPECGPNNVIDKPDYYANYVLSQSGIYKLTLTAKTKDGTRWIDDLIEVKESVPFEVERIGPTRIYPIAQYEMKIKIKANQDFKGQVIERVPSSFEVWEPGSRINITEVVLSPGGYSEPKIIKKTTIPIDSEEKPQFTTEDKEEIKEIIWSVNWQAGKEYQLNYILDAPDIAPEFYLLGPLTIGSWQEARYWQIASDATDKTFVFLSDAESWSATPSVDTDTMAWDNTTGCPDAGSLKSESTKAGGGGENANDNYWEWSGNWENLGVTPGNVVTQVRGGYRYKHPNHGGVDNNTGPLEFRISGGCTLEGTLLVAATLSAAQATCQTRTQGSDVAVPAGYQASTSTICFHLNNDTDLGGGGKTTTWNEDTIYLTITDAAPNNAPVISSVEDGPDPIEVGQVINFDVYWSDQDAEGVKIVICKSNSVTEADPPVCPGGEWCYSDKGTYDLNSPLSCAHRITSADIGTKDYYAFACDNNPECSAVSSGQFIASAFTGPSLRFNNIMKFKFRGIIK